MSTLYMQLKQIVKTRPELLKIYKTDFTKHDKEFLRNAKSGKAIWSIHETGTNMTRISSELYDGCTPGEASKRCRNTFFLACYDMEMYSNSQTYLLDLKAQTFKPVKSMDEIKRLVECEYETRKQMEAV